ncbi:MAG TPA: nucleotidyltransferase domain-containing protein [Gemmataceae bacterium]|nr:nucleotidyltransferase domain-containing protein [Gemmataceae bacterium]
MAVASPPFYRRKHPLTFFRRRLCRARYRVLLTGIYLMQSGEVQANLPRLNETVRLPYLDDLIQQKVAGAEKERLNEADLSLHRREYERLRNKLQQAYEASELSDAPRASAALHDLLVKLRLSHHAEGGIR